MTPNKDSRLKVAVVGTGAMATKHSQVLAVHNGAELSLICSTPRSRSKALGFQQTYGFHQVETDFEKVLESEDVDAVVICSPDDTHADFVVRALNRGKHVLCEKPLARSESEFDAISAALSRSGATLQVGMNCRYRAPYFRPFEIGQELGPLRFLRGTYLLNKIATVKEGLKPWWEATGDSYFFLHANGIHILDLMRWYGGEVRNVFARSVCLEMKDQFKADTFSISLEFKSGALGELLISLSAFQPREIELEAWYRDGTIKGDRLYRRDGDQTCPSEDIEVEQPLLDLHLQFQDFVRACSGERVPVNNLDEARANFRLIQALERSIRTGSVVEVTAAVTAS